MAKSPIVTNSKLVQLKEFMRGMVNLTKVFLGWFWGNGSFFNGAQSHAPNFFLTGVCPVGRGLVKGL